MKTIVCIFFFAILFTHSVFAATVSLNGTVKDSSGAGIAGVKVSLAVNKNSATTDAQGAFILNGTNILKSQSLLKPQFRLILAGSALVIFPAFENTKGFVDVFSSNGRKNASMPFSGTRAGKQTVNLPEFVSGLSIIRVTIGNEIITQTLVCLGGSDGYLKNDMTYATAAGNFSLTKLAALAAVDTLIATKSGYSNVKLPIDSYVKQDIAIVMQKSVTGPMPLVYDKEFTGADCPKPTLVDDPTTLPAITYLPDPFLMADGKTRMTSRDQWQCRRAEIKAILEKYDDGEKPGKPEKFSATLSGGTINITCGVGSNTITLTATIKRPSSAPNAPIPAIIGINGDIGSLYGGTDESHFTSRNIAMITFTSSQIQGDGMMSSASWTSGNFYKLYPQTTAGSMVRWAWGISRIIDALEILPEAKIDVKHIAVSGCSYQGKIALFAGAYDERIALTIPHESGGGGTISWRYSDMLEDRDNTEVENLHHAQGDVWYAQVLGKYIPKSMSPNSLPYDHHELIGMIAPRAVLCIESVKIARMGAEAARVDALAARRIWAALGVPDRIGVTEADVDHCTWTTSYTPDVDAYLDKFLLGKEAKTDFLRSKFTSVDTTKWIPWTTPELK